MFDSILVKQHASDALRYARNSDSRCVEALKNFYIAGKESPSISRLIMKNEQLNALSMTMEYLRDDIASLRGKPSELAKEWLTKHLLGAQNLSLAHRAEEVIPAIIEFNTTLEKLYPKTGNLREILIEKSRIVMDAVKPKAGFFKKLKLKKFLPK